MSYPTGTVTFLYTDIEGSTQLTQKHPDSMPDALARHHAILHQAITQHNGYVFRIIGDEFNVAFATALDALAAALAAQRALHEQPWGETPIRVRMGLHTGPATPRADDYDGYLTLSHTKRLMSTAYGGQLLLSDATEALLRDQLPQGVTLRDLGKYRLKDFDRAEHLFQVVAPELPADFPPLKSLHVLPNNLPTQLTSFIGRERELAEVKQLLSNTRLLTLTGPGGTGKTRLALQIAEELLPSFIDGVWLVELAPLTDPALIPQTIASVFELREAPHTPLMDILANYLRAKQLLLVLDNCEHLVETCAQMADTLLHAAPGLKILASSRESLGIAGETAYRVPPLSLPDPRQSSNLNALSQNDCVHLFLDRASAAYPHFHLTAKNAAAIAQICVRLDGIPLAIELAAARTKAFPPEEIAARLDDRFRLLTGGSRTALPRHQTLCALIDWSYDLLSEAERVLLRRLSVFAGGWTFEAVQAVCADGLDDEVLDLLTHLVDKSLVVVEEEAEEGRYRLLETIRQYGRDKLFEAGESEQVRNRHLDFFLALTETAESKLTGPEQGVWIKRLDLENDNLRTALEWTNENPERTEDGLRLATALARFWAVRDLQGGRKHLGSLLAHLSGQPQSPLRAKALGVAADLASRQGDHRSAHAYWQESLTIRRKIGNSSEIANSVRGLGNVALATCDFAMARHYYEESLSLCRLASDENGMAWSFSNLGLVAWNEGDYATADQLLKESLAIRQAKGDKGGIAYVLNLFGLVAWTRGDYVTMRSLNEKSSRIQSELDDRWNLAYSLDSLGLAAFGQRDYASARIYFLESLGYFRDLGDMWGISYALERFAGLASACAQPIPAARLFGAAEAFREAIHLPMQPGERAQYERNVAAVRAILSEEVLKAEWAEGRALTLEQAIALATENESEGAQLPKAGPSSA